eukprot:SAG22_NODE_8055_length_687_cov_0.926871_1_plen_78_part_10
MPTAAGPPRPVHRRIAALDRQLRAGRPAGHRYDAAATPQAPRSIAAAGSAAGESPAGSETLTVVAGRQLGPSDLMMGT